jgi:hypothetical protein
MNYLQYIKSVQPATQTVDSNYLVSGVDSRVRLIVGQQILGSLYNEGKILFILDNTQSRSTFPNFGEFKVVNPLNGNVNLCNDLLEVRSLGEISRLRSLLVALGFDGNKAMKVVTYLSFVKETERRLGNNRLLRIEDLEKYSGTVLVKHKLRQLVENKSISIESYDYLLGRYAEVSAAAADFDMFLLMFAPFLSGSCQPTAGSAVHLPIGEFGSDRPMQEVLCKLSMSFIKMQPASCSILILDDGKSDRSCIVDILKTLPTATSAHMFTTDAFALGEEDLNLLMSMFPVRIYSRHSSMNSCSKIESYCGHINVVRRSYSTTVDKRIRASSAFDMLLGTNRTETEVRNVPIQEARYRKETINALCLGTAIIDCSGIQSLVQF